MGLLDSLRKYRSQPMEVDEPTPTPPPPSPQQEPEPPEQDQEEADEARPPAPAARMRQSSLSSFFQRGASSSSSAAAAAAPLRVRAPAKRPPRPPLAPNEDTPHRAVVSSRVTQEEMEVARERAGAPPPPPPPPPPHQEEEETQEDREHLVINLARDLRMHDTRSDPTREGQQYVLERMLRDLDLRREDLFSDEELASMSPAQMADAEQQILKMALRAQVWANEWAQEQAEELIQRARKQCLDEGVDPDTVVLDSDASRDGDFLSLPELAVQLCTNVTGQMPCSAGNHCEWNQVVQTYAHRYQGRSYPVVAKGSAFVPGRYLRSREAYEAYVGGRREGGPCALCMVLNIAGLDLLCMKGNRDPRHNHRNWPFHMRVAEGELKETAVVGSCARGDTVLSAPEGSLPSCSVTSGRPRSTSVFPSVEISSLVMAWVHPGTGERLSQAEFLRLEDGSGYMPQLFVDVEDMQMTADSQVTTRDVRSSASASADGKSGAKGGGGGGAKGDCCGAHPRGMPRSAYSVPLMTARVCEQHGREPPVPEGEESVAWMPEWRFLRRRWQQLRAHRREAGTGEDRRDGRSGMEFFR